MNNKIVLSLSIVSIISVVCLSAIAIKNAADKSQQSKSASTNTTKATEKPATETSKIPQITENLSPTVTVSPTPASKYSATVKALVRTEFINNCVKHYGNDSQSACSCGADYLSSHYSEEVLAKVYVAYHANGKVTPEIQSAIDACKDK